MSLKLGQSNQKSESARGNDSQKLSSIISKKSFWFLALVILIVLSLSSSYLFFVTGDSQLERDLRSQISKTFRALSNLDADEFNKPVAIKQTFLYDEALVAFTDKVVYQAGDTIRLSYSSPDQLEGQLSYKDLGGPSKSVRLNLGTSPYSRPLTVDSFDGFDPVQFAVIDISLKGFNPGWHQIHLTGGSQSKFLAFFIEPSKNDKKVIFVESTNTLKAYVSDVGLRTHYSNPGSLLGQFSRPEGYPLNYKIEDYLGAESTSVSCSDHLVNADLVIKQRLIELGLDFQVVSDAWVENQSNLENVDLVILGAHNEYWSAKKFDSMTSFMENQGSLLVLGGNTAWRFHEQTDQGYSLIWGNGVHGTRHMDFVRNYLGSYFDSRDYGTYSNFQLNNELPNFLDGIQLSREFGIGTKFALCESEVSGSSGHETDKLIDTNSRFQVLARGKNLLGGADVVYAETPSRGHVLNFGSLALWHGMSDQTTINIVEAFLKIAKVLD